MRDRKYRVAIVGLNWGRRFIEIYRRHPFCESVALCQRDANKLAVMARDHAVSACFSNLEQVLADPSIDAVHIATPIADHAQMSIASLRAGKHVACAVPMAASISDCAEIVRASRASRKVYMMMETAVYRREFLYVMSLKESGVLGRLQLLRASHLQDMDPYPSYWYGLPPMHYATHAIAPLSVLASGDVDQVVCFGSGRIREELIRYHNSPFAAETTLIRFRGSDVAAEVTRWMYDTARQYVESFDVYGEKTSFEWNRLLGQPPMLFRKEGEPEHITIPETTHLLPQSIAEFAASGSEHDELGGSYPHLVHEFLSAIAEGRPASIDAERAANWTCAGLCAHQSAMSGGAPVTLPRFE
jgi:predicted dehydrogenase